jgi:hypothetical protein
VEERGDRHQKEQCDGKKNRGKSLPTYAMEVFQFPTGLIDELSKIIRDFWCGDDVGITLQITVIALSCRPNWRPMKTLDGKVGH